MGAFGWDLVAQGGLNAIGSLIGGKMQYDAQKKANETNLQIAQEYNQMQRDIVQQNNDLQYKMFQESNFYNSPENQRAMLEAAGYNPYSLYQNPSGGVAYSQSLPQLQQPQFAVPQVQPENAFGSAIQNAVASSAAVIKTLADANKTKNESDLLSMQKQTYQQRLVLELQNLGFDAEAKELANNFARDSFDDRLRGLNLDNMLKDSQNYLVNQNLRQAVFDYELAKTFGFKLKQKELDKLQSEIALNDEKAITERVEQYAKKYDVDYKSALLSIERARVDIERTRASTEQFRAQNESRYINAQVLNLNSLTKNQRLDNDLKVARNRIYSAAMKLGSDPISNMIKRDVYNTAMTPENMKMQLRLVAREITQAKTYTDRMKLQNYYDAIELGIKALDAASKYMNHSQSNRSSKQTFNYDKDGNLIGSQVVNDTYQSLYQPW